MSSPKLDHVGTAALGCPAEQSSAIDRHRPLCHPSQLCEGTCALLGLRPRD